MKLVIIISLIFSICSTAWTAPSLLRMTPSEFKVFQTGLEGGKPLFLQSALSIMTIKDVKEDRSVLLNIGSKDGHYRPQFGQRFSSEPKLSASRPKTSFQKVMPFASMNGNNNFIYGRPLQDFAITIYRDDLANLTPITKRLQLIKKQNIRNKRDVMKVKENEDVKIIKRQTDYEDEDYDYDDYDYEDEPVRYAEELGFGLSTAGGVLGGAVGGYLDTTGTATLKLIRSLESLGLIALSQLDNFLDAQDEEKKKKEEEDAARAAAAAPYSINESVVSIKK